MYRSVLPDESQYVKGTLGKMATHTKWHFTLLWAEIFVENVYAKLFFTISVGKLRNNHQLQYYGATLLQVGVNFFSIGDL